MLYPRNGCYSSPGLLPPEWHAPFIELASAPGKHQTPVGVASILPQMHFIFEIVMQPGYPPERYAEAWVRASEIIQRAPGAMGTRLHRKIGSPDVLLAIAKMRLKQGRYEIAETQLRRVLELKPTSTAAAALLAPTAQHTTVFSTCRTCAWSRTWPSSPRRMKQNYVI